MLKFLVLIKKKLHWLIMTVMIAALLNLKFFGGFEVSKTVLVSIVIFLVIFPVMINTDFARVFAHFKEPRPVFCSLALNFMVSPLIAWVIALFFLGEHPGLATALLIISLLPTSAMSAAWTSFSGARMSTALYLIPINLLFAAFVGLPFILSLFLGDDYVINKTLIIKNILLVFLMPLILGDLTRRVLVRIKGPSVYQETIKPQLGGVSALGVLTLLFLVISLKRNQVLLDNMGMVWTVLVPVVLYYALMYLGSVSWALFLIRRRVLPGDKAVVIVYTSVARHVNISMAVVLSTFPIESAPTMILLLIIGYIIQVPSLALFAQHYGRKMTCMIVKSWHGTRPMTRPNHLAGSFSSSALRNLRNG